MLTVCGYIIITTRQPLAEEVKNRRTEGEICSDIEGEIVGKEAK